MYIREAVAGELILFPKPGRAVHPLQRRFGRLLQRRRLAADLSQEALAEKAGLHRNYIGLLERGQRMPSILVAQRLANALDTTMSELLAEADR